MIDNRKKLLELKLKAVKSTILISLPIQTIARRKDYHVLHRHFSYLNIGLICSWIFH